MWGPTIENKSRAKNTSEKGSDAFWNLNSKKAMGKRKCGCGWHRPGCWVMDQWWSHSAELRQWRNRNFLMFSTWTRVELSWTIRLSLKYIYLLKLLLNMYTLYQPFLFCIFFFLKENSWNFIYFKLLWNSSILMSLGRTTWFTWINLFKIFLPRVELIQHRTGLGCR